MHKIKIMKKVFSTQFIIFIIAAIVAFVYTIYIGDYVANKSSFYWNTFLVNLTFMGDAFFAFAIIFFMLIFFKQKQLASKLLITTIICLAIVQVVKNIFHAGALQIFFESGITENDGEYSFGSNIISSHTAVAFTLVITLSMHIQKMYATILFLTLALLVTYTRLLLGVDNVSTIIFSIIPILAITYFLYKTDVKKAAIYGYYYRNKKESKEFLQNALRV